MVRLAGDLGHPHGVAGGVEAVEGGGIRVELVAEDEDKVAHGGFNASMNIEKTNSRVVI
jgi:hypothetical protein